MPAERLARRVVAALLTGALCAATPGGAGPSTSATPAGPAQRPASPTDAGGDAPPAGLSRSAPTRIDIDTIDVDAPLTRLGLDGGGALEDPPVDRADLAGWYALGASPGEVGAAVITGHVDTRTGPSVFYRLEELGAGDSFDIRRADGSAPRFVVEATEWVDKDAFPTERVYGRLPFPGVRLVTCGGRFDETSGHYEENLIVYARLAGTQPARAAQGSG